VSAPRVPLAVPLGNGHARLTITSETLAKALQRRLRAQSVVLWANAAELRHLAETTRATVAEQVKRSPTRRMARHAQGRRDLTGDGSARLDGKLVETRAPRCPHCQSVRIMRLEKSEIVDARVRTDSACLVCEKVFVYSRKTAVQLAREELLRESHEQPPHDPKK
jgi:hypothetical protein